MALKFSSTDSLLHDLQVWHAESDGYSFAISHESRNRPGLNGESGFIASWRPKNGDRAMPVEGSPFATFEEAEKACALKHQHLIAP